MQSKCQNFSWREKQTWNKNLWNIERKKMCKELILKLMNQKSEDTCSSKKRWLGQLALPIKNPL
jgi:hypothetical protein